MLATFSPPEPDVLACRPTPAPPPPAPTWPPSSLAPGLVAAGEALERVGVPGSLTGASRVPVALRRFEGRGIVGTGTHLGSGYVVTARHVADLWRSPRAQQRTRGSTRRERFGAFCTGWEVRYVPPAGTHSPGLRAAVRPEHAGRCRDWILLHGPELLGAPSLPLRSSSSVGPGERVWLVGDYTGSAYRVASATFERVAGVNAWLSDCDVDTGFSGSPALDAWGRVIGLCVTMMAGGRCLLVGSDCLLKRLDRLRRS